MVISSQTWLSLTATKSGTPKVRITSNGARLRNECACLSVMMHRMRRRRRLRKEAELNAINHGVSVAPEAGNGHGSIAAAVRDFLDETGFAKKPKTLAAYTTALNYFTESCWKLYLEDLERKDLLEFVAFLREDKEQAPRSCWNKFPNVMTFLKANGIRGLVGKNDWPRYTEEEPEIYEHAELDKLFRACYEEERLWFEFFLMTGMREQEVMYTYWSDVNLSSAVSESAMSRTVGGRQRHTRNVRFRFPQSSPGS
jgi:hypothetical protein